MARRPSNVSFEVASNDPFALQHLGELLQLQAIESTYRTKSGAPPLGTHVVSPAPDRQDMQRLFVHDEDRVLLKVVHYGNDTSVGIEVDERGEWQFKPLWARRAGPRALMYFEPATVVDIPELQRYLQNGAERYQKKSGKFNDLFAVIAANIKYEQSMTRSRVTAAIITCGGLCPGLNDVIRQIVFTLDMYGVKNILGIQYGFKGLVDPKLPPVALNRQIVSRIHMHGGSFLGVSRGTPDLKDIVDKLEEWKVNFFFVIGGNGSHAGAHAIYQQCRMRKMKIVVVGVPKTIDNDIQLVDKTFGFDTAVEEAQRAINAAYVEASSAVNGVGIVKLMGRQSGYIAMYATLASGQVDVVLIPEVPFVLEGENGVFQYMQRRLNKNGICVVVIAEGAGQDLVEGRGGNDASGNPVLGDIGKWFHGQVKEYFGKIKMSVDVKYIDPTYMIRARPCNSSDHIFCSVLGQNAVHGAFAGYTDITVGLVNTHYCLLPISEVIRRARVVDPNSNMWHRCVTSTGQPEFADASAKPKRFSSLGTPYFNSASSSTSINGLVNGQSSQVPQTSPKALSPRSTPGQKSPLMSPCLSVPTTSTLPVEFPLRKSESHRRTTELFIKIDKAVKKCTVMSNINLSLKNS